LIGFISNYQLTEAPIPGWEALGVKGAGLRYWEQEGKAQDECRAERRRFALLLKLVPTVRIALTLRYHGENKLATIRQSHFAEHSRP
jgi:hypothetical protein